MSTPKKILIIGGGFTGLTAAYKLSRESDFSITLVESSGHLGGLAAGFPLLGTSLEKAYHHLFLTDTDILQLVEELDLAGNPLSDVGCLDVLAGLPQLSVLLLARTPLAAADNPRADAGTQVTPDCLNPPSPSSPTCVYIRGPRGPFLDV